LHSEEPSDDVEKEDVAFGQKCGEKMAGKKRKFDSGILSLANWNILWMNCVRSLVKIPLPESVR